MAAPQKPPKKIIRSFSTTPLASLLAAKSTASGAMPFLSFGLAAIVAAIEASRFHSLYFLGRGLHSTLRWFEGDLVTRATPGQLDALREALPITQAITTVDCSAMQGVADLAAEFAARHGAMRWPENPAKKAAAILAKAMARNHHPKVLVLLDADGLEARDRDGFGRFLAEWQHRMHKETPPVLLFLAVAQPVAASAEPAPPEPPAVPDDA
ncbi:MAG: hypothetical protein JNK15_12140, partial [Planctomycetes bacterium]|nr:hypothetical protein [Planctomycetota bacterium]